MLKFPSIEPVIYSIGPLSVSWYSLSYVCGILIAWQYAKYIVDRFKLKMSHIELDTFVTYIIVAIIVGGRLGYCIFYDPYKFLNHPIDILKTYEGGMSFHGAFIAVLISVYIFYKKYSINIILLLDILAAVVSIGIFLGRIANFINQELYGKVTDVPWAFVFPNVDNMPRHPSQLYEAFFEGVFSTIVLAIATFKFQSIKRSGFNTGLSLLLYSISRIGVEFFRDQTSYLYQSNYITMGQILTLPMFFLGLYITIKAIRCTPR